MIEQTRRQVKVEVVAWAGNHYFDRKILATAWTDAETGEVHCTVDFPPHVPVALLDSYLEIGREAAHEAMERLSNLQCPSASSE